MKQLKVLGNISLGLFMLFLVFNIGLYLYCYITPRIDINKAQGYYLYGRNTNENKNKRYFKKYYR